MMIRDRIREFRRVQAKNLLPNPKNWRTHSNRQRDILQGVLAEIGYADALLARELPDKTLQLIDGHLRAETTPLQEVPVLILDLSEEEANKLLTVLDPISSLAGKNETLLKELIDNMETENQSVQSFLNEMIQQEPEILSHSMQDLNEVELPALYQVVVECDDEDTQQNLYEELTNRGYKIKLLNL